jgi:hypothetical protein
MLQKQFAKYWKAKKKNKSYSKCVPKFNVRKTLTTLLNELLKAEDFRKLNYENRIVILRNIFGNSSEQFNNIEQEIKTAIKIGYNVKIEKEI